MSYWFFVFPCILAIQGALGAPIRSDMSSLVVRDNGDNFPYSGTMKWTDYQGGPTACGYTITQDRAYSKNLISVRGELWDNGNNCGKHIQVKFSNGEIHRGKIVDTCGDGCDILGSPNLFEKGFPLEKGTQTVSWGPQDF